MKVSDAIKWAIENLVAEGADPQREEIQSLFSLVGDDSEVPSGDIKLSAKLSPGGVAEVFDQHGRRVHGVKSVAVFDDRGVPVFQVNL